MTAAVRFAREHDLLQRVDHEPAEHRRAHWVQLEPQPRDDAEVAAIPRTDRIGDRAREVLHGVATLVKDLPEEVHGVDVIGLVVFWAGKRRGGRAGDAAAP